MLEDSCISVQCLPPACFRSSWKSELLYALVLIVSKTPVLRLVQKVVLCLAGAMGGYGAGMGGGYGGRGGMGRGGSEYGGDGSSIYGGGGGGRGRRPEHDFVEGKLFLGGLDTQTTKETLVEYCTQW